jgi:hypothetical protein
MRCHPGSTSGRLGERARRAGWRRERGKERDGKRTRKARDRRRRAAPTSVLQGGRRAKKSRKICFPTLGNTPNPEKSPLPPRETPRIAKSRLSQTGREPESHRVVSPTGKKLAPRLKSADCRSKSRLGARNRAIAAQEVGSAAGIPRSSLEKSSPRRKPADHRSGNRCGVRNRRIFGLSAAGLGGSGRSSLVSATWS